MSIVAQNIPFFCLLWIGIGFIFIILGMFKLASQTEANNHYVEFSPEKLNKNYNKEVEELFSYFLEEEEKKNQDLREILLNTMDKKDKSSNENSQSIAAINHLEDLTAENLSNEMYTAEDFKKSPRPHHTNKSNEIIKLYDAGLRAEEIAKKLKKGVGEVNLMISLYTMR